MIWSHSDPHLGKRQREAPASLHRTLVFTSTGRKALGLRRLGSLRAFSAAWHVWVSQNEEELGWVEVIIKKQISSLYSREIKRLNSCHIIPKDRTSHSKQRVVMERKLPVA